MVNVPFPKKEEQLSELKKGSQLKNFEVQQDLLPPQNIEAEEAIIGGILLVTGLNTNKFGAVM